jgi:hypothetical protein
VDSPKIDSSQTIKSKFAEIELKEKDTIDLHITKEFTNLTLTIV